MQRLVFEFAFRSALIAAAAALVLRVLRIRAAAAQHAFWAGVLVVMLALPIWMAWGPKAALPVLPARGEPAVPITAAPVNLASPAPAIPAPLEVSDPASKPPVWSWAAVRSWKAIWIGAYLLGAGALLLRLGIGTIRANRLTSASCAAPVTVGLLRPRVILPRCWSTWPQAQLDAVLTHERAHARRRDPLVQWLALLNRALFWFHPLAWWLERRLTALAEEACDAAVLEHGHDPRDYSEYLLDLARAVQRAGMRVNVTGMAMPGSDLPQRIKKIIAGVSASRVSPARMWGAAVACAICSSVFAAAEPVRRPARALLAQATAAPQVVAQSAAASTPKFEVASIKPCRDAVPLGGRKGGGRESSPGRLNVDCQTVHGLIQMAYIIFANGHVNLPGSGSVPIEGGPDWIHSDRYRIDAKAEGLQGQGPMHGPMLQALLEDRFKLKIHRETREVPVYALTVAKGGPKLKQFKEGSCTPIDFTIFTQFPPPPLPDLPPGQKYCPNLGTMKGPNVAVDAQGTSLDEFSKFFLSRLDRPVINKTGITGLFDFHLEYAADETTLLLQPGGGDSADPAGPSIFTALQQQLGLKLEPAKGPGEFLVIDRVERPSGN